MHDFRKRSNHPGRAMDGFVSAPQRLHSFSQPTGSSGGHITPDRFKTASSPRRLDDFKRPNGYHPTTRSITQPRRTAPTIQPLQSAPRPQAPRPQQSSILHMTLPGGELETDHKLRKKKSKRQNKPLTKWGKVRKWSLRSGIAMVVIVLLLGGFLLA